MLDVGMTEKTLLAKRIAVPRYFIGDTKNKILAKRCQKEAT